MPGLVVRPDTAACAEPFMHGCMLAVDGGEHARAPPSDSAGVLAGAAHSVRAAVAPLLPGAGTAVWVAVGAGLLALELSWLADVLGLRDATQPALLAGTSRDVKARVATRVATAPAVKVLKVLLGAGALGAYGAWLGAPGPLVMAGATGVAGMYGAQQHTATSALHGEIEGLRRRVLEAERRAVEAESRVVEAESAPAAAAGGVSDRTRHSARTRLKADASTGRPYQRADGLNAYNTRAAAAAGRSPSRSPSRSRAMAATT
jgi:hypothetical protein